MGIHELHANSIANLLNLRIYLFNNFYPLNTFGIQESFSNVRHISIDTEVM